MAGKT